MLRHINNPRIHDGRAVPNPYVEYLSGLQSGLYGPPTAYQYLRRNRSIQGGIRVLTERTYIDKVQEKVAEKAVEKFADSAVGMTTEQNRTSLPTQHSNRQAFSVQGYSFSEKVFLELANILLYDDKPYEFRLPIATRRPYI